MTDVTRVPAELRRHKAWLLWKYEAPEKPGGKPRKVPSYVGGGRRSGAQGSAQDRRRLATFDEAAAALLWGPWEGIGFAMLPDWGLVGLDFDACVVDGEVVPEVLDAVSGTYAEFSPSGTGVRAFVRGAIADKKSKGEDGGFGFETFHGKGFLTITGAVLPVCELVGWDDHVAHLNGAVPALFEARFGGDGAIVVREPGRVGGPKPEGLSDDQLSALLAWVSPDYDYLHWAKRGMALHHETCGEQRGLDLWDAHSAGGKDYPGTEVLTRKWNTFGKGDGPVVTIAWLRGEAERQSNGAAIDDSAFEPVGTGGASGSAGADGAVAEELQMPAWKRNKAGDVEPTVTNAVMALRRADLCGCRVAHDEFRDEITVSAPGVNEWRPMTDADVVRMRMRLESLRFKSVPKELARDGLVLVAADNRYDSAQLWLRDVESRWDGRRRVDEFLVRYMGCKDGEYERAVGRYMWTALAGRVLQPGVKCDMVPIYEGGQGLQKSSAIEAMVPAPEFFVEVDLEDDEADTVRKLRGALVGEIAELSGLHTRALEAIKKFVVRKVEKWVPKYKEFPSTFARRLLFVGTTNRTDILADETGNRRWLPVHIEMADAAGIGRDRDQLWAEGAAMFRGLLAGEGVGAGVAWEAAERLAGGFHDAYTVEDPWAGAVNAWLGEADPFDGVGASSVSARRGAKPFTSHELMAGALGLHTKEMDKLAQKRVGAILRRAKYVPMTVRRDGMPAWCWIRPE